jgi:hypothetical protein
MTTPRPTTLLKLSPINRSTKSHIPLLNLPASEQFRHNIINFLRATIMASDEQKAQQHSHVPQMVPAPPALKKIAPYWYPYTTMTKMRWIGRELLEVVSTEFRDRSMEYYVRPLNPGRQVERANNGNAIAFHSGMRWNPESQR